MGNASTIRKAIVNTSYLRVRTGPSTRAAILGLLKQGAVVDVVKTLDGWALVEMRVGGAAMRLQSAPDPVYAYMQLAYLTFNSTGTTPDPTPAPTPTPEPTPAPDPVPAAGFAMGINALQNTALALEEAQRGCRHFLIMDDFGGAGALKRAHPQATVMVRRYFPQSFFLSPDQVIQGLEGANHGALIYTGFNEADQGGQDGDALRTRARIDIAVARKIKERNPAATYAAGTFSMGTPDFTNAATCQIIREEYAPHYNSGLIALDMHLYSPNPQHIDKPAEWQWFERRWEFLFTKCGFDPKVRAIYCSETGLDQGGIGGFPAHGATQQYFRDWCRKYIALQNAPLVIGGKSYPSPIRGGAIFQLGGNGDQRWQGYNISGYLPVLREFYGGKAASSNSPGARRSLPKLLPEIRIGKGADAASSAQAVALDEPAFELAASSKTAAERLKSALSSRAR